ncbi:MAG TPA: serine hydrolase domain-containing protein [Terriglobales bacterium]|jgi:CubicO group peptidase (beta-lactamase class C family)|nr:serine hydrolase domain-containing protein [Terriglobales bacterium]
MFNQENIQAALQPVIDHGQLAGAATLVWQESEGEALSTCVGWRDLEAMSPIVRDTIFRIASMTKPITSVAALMLVDQGKIDLDEPITRYAPEFSRMQVLRSPNGPLNETVAAEHPITFGDLLTHRAGLSYADFHRGPLARAYRETLGGDIDSHVLPDDWIGGLARLPLVCQPGTAMTYGCATDLLGLLIARIEGERLGAVLERLIFAPLKMKDTSFVVPREKWDRRAAAYGFDESGHLIKRVTFGGGIVAERPLNMAYESGGAGLWSTADDYLRFARLFLNDGAVEDTRLLRPQTLKKMMSNQLTDSQRANFSLFGGKPFAVGRGFGLGVSVVLETDDKDFMRRGGVGTVSWPGAFGGWWQADPKEGSVLIFLAHNMVDLEQMANGIGLEVWSTIIAFQSAAMVPQSAGR